MKITAIPRKGSSVSTRVHFYYYLNNLPEGYEWEHHKKNFGDVLYVQKKADDETVKIAKKAKSLGVPIVYDCDDNPKEKPGSRRTTMLALADAVTTDTEERGKQLKEASGVENIIVIPECLDYVGMIRPVGLRRDVNILITFGNNSNAVHSAKYMKYVDIECRHINAKPIEGAGKFVPWNLDTFTEDLSKGDVCLLAHNDDRKSNLKLLVAMAMGIPTIVSDTKAYRETYDKMGLNWLVAKRFEDTKEILERLKPIRERKNIRLRYAEYDWKLHQPKEAAKRLAKVFEKVIHEKSIS